MQSINRITLFILLALIQTGCVRQYFPETLDYDNMLFVRALVTDNPDIPPSVSLSYTSPVNPTSTEPVTPEDEIFGATVYIERDDLVRYYFHHSFGPAVTYLLVDTTITLRENSSYMLVIETASGNQFRSDYQEYIPAPGIEEIKYAYERDQLYETGEQVEGYRFYISTFDSGDRPMFLRWQLDHTYKYKVPFLADHWWDGYNLYDTINVHLMKCYMNEPISGLYLGTTDGMSENRIVDDPLHFVSQYGDALSIRYSLHTWQFRISESAYRFWKDMKSLSYEAGGLYETQPFLATGNIYCVSDPAVKVAGIFEVAGVSEHRIFVPPPEEFELIPEVICIPDTISADFPWDKVPPYSWITESVPGVCEWAENICFDCTLRGGSIYKPPFWDQ